jgi:glycerophosphoryl diester phosphodiesterase
VVAWTANDPGEMQKLIAAGVDGIITDYPDRLVELLRTAQGQKR